MQDNAAEEQHSQTPAHSTAVWKTPNTKSKLEGSNCHGFFPLPSPRVLVPLLAKGKELSPTGICSEISSLGISCLNRHLVLLMNLVLSAYSFCLLLYLNVEVLSTKTLASATFSSFALH